MKVRNLADNYDCLGQLLGRLIMKTI